MDWITLGINYGLVGLGMVLVFIVAGFAALAVGGLIGWIMETQDDEDDGNGEAP